MTKSALQIARAAYQSADCLEQQAEQTVCRYSD